MVEQREIRRREANLPGYSGMKISNSSYPTTKTYAGLKEQGNKENTVFPIRTITLRGSPAKEIKKEGPSRRLSDAEFQAKREKGLCFKCDEKYYSGHKCKAKDIRELRMFVVRDDDVEEEIIEEDEYDKKNLRVMELQHDPGEVVELCINSVVGLTNPGTMKIRGTLQSKEVVVLVDCGATHNFISDRLVKTLKIPTKDTANYGVILGSGTAIKGKGVCEKVELNLIGWTVVENFLPLELGGVDLILGMQWLHSLGVTEKDWRNLTMSFFHNSRKVVLKGDPSLTKTQNIGGTSN
ncbi:uncharacterized protein LOC116402457 [Cucumis sativus]|uniref:uncharacterized protein LOC116402457 n=1 Tax=Cucumis sativus TaxID=3659 RepID=UPI0012F50F82|nr:uncharacterized protein LOC116402457 [Cucumis sativus]